MKAPKSESKEAPVTGFTSSLWSSTTASSQPQTSYGFGNNPNNNNGTASSVSNGEMLMQQRQQNFRLDLRPAVLLRNDSEDTATPQSRSESPAFHADGSMGLSAPHLALVASPIATRHRRFFPESSGGVNLNNSAAVNTSLTSFNSVNSSLGMSGSRPLATVEEGIEHEGGAGSSSMGGPGVGVGHGHGNRGGCDPRTDHHMDGRDDDDIHILAPTF